MKRLSLPVLLFAVFLLFFRPEAALSGAKEALLLAGGTVIPSLFPFFFFSGLLLETGAAERMGKFFSPVMRPLFHVSGQGALPFLVGLFGGYPLGARTAADLYQKGDLSGEDYARLAAYCNNAGPLFAVGTVGVGMLGSARLGGLLFLSHILAAFTVGILFRFITPRVPEKRSVPSAPRSSDAPPLSRAMDAAVWSSFTVAGYIILFGTLLSVFSSVGFLSLIGSLFPLAPNALSSGIFEMTTGISHLPQDLSPRLLLPLAGLLLGWGGLSVHLQAGSFMSAKAFFPSSYWWGKLLSALFTALYAALFARFVPYSLPTLATGIYPDIITSKALTVYLILYLVAASLFFRYFATKKR